MKQISRLLVAGGLTITLLLVGCGQGTTADTADSPANTVEETATTDADSEGAPLESNAPAIESLDGWWKVASLETVDGSVVVDEAFINDYTDRFHTNSVFKVNSQDKTFQMNTLLIAMYGTVGDAASDGWFTLNPEAGAGLYVYAELISCHIEDDGALKVKVEIPLADAASDEDATTVFTCVRSDELKDKAASTSVYDHAWDTYMEFRNANNDLSIEWYAEPQVVAENDSVVMLLWGVGETSDSYIVMTGIVNKENFPLLVGNYYTETPLMANGDVEIAPDFGCYLTAGQADQSYDCPIYIKKSDIDGELKTLSGTLDITLISLGDWCTLDFDISL